MTKTQVLRPRRSVPTQAAAAILGILATAGVAAGQQPSRTPAGAAIGQAPARTIQVLTDVPTAQMIPTMRVISASLGVECEFCHETNRTLNTEKKDVARKMMTMTLALNKASFGDSLRVTCFTCHRGSSTPLATPTPTGQYTALGVGVLFKGNGSPVPGGQDAVLSERFREYVAKEKSSLPPPEQILSTYINALGGEQALRRITARKITATTEVPADVRAVGPAVHALTQQYFKAPNQWVITSQSASGTTSSGFDGTVAWRQDARGVVAEVTGAVPAPPLSRVKRTADFYEPLNLKQAYPRMITRGTAKVRDRDAYLIVGYPDGDLPEQLFFDTQTGLLLRRGTATATALGEYAVQTDYDDYREVGGVKIPYLVRTIGISPADGVTTQIEKVDINPQLDAGLFIKPISK
ncbi:MAG: photosynthetic reaction center cytochrome c subunit family protein [Acidobacteriota bacterium]